MASTTLQKILADNLEGILSRNGFSLDGGFKSEVHNNLSSQESHVFSH